jgi:hypothetical protein
MKRKLILIASFALIIGFALSFSTLFGRNAEKRYIVKLFSGERVISQWTSTSIGTIEGTSLTFTSLQGLNPIKLQIRICGKYTVEEIAQ